MKLDEDVLRRAAEIVRDKKIEEINQLEQEMPEHIFSDEFEANMQTLIAQVKRGEIKPYKVSMGWQYYVRHGMVAVLVCALLTCIAAPQAVMAGYHKIVDVIETVVTEYTEYRYHVNNATNSELGKITFGYLPEGLELIEEENLDSLYSVDYRNENSYFKLEVTFITEEDGLTHVVDTEDASIETYQIQNDEMKVITKRGANSFTWLHNQHLVTGQTNYSVEELVTILQNIKFETILN